MNKNINFFDNLDGGWGDLIANVYEDSIDKYNITITYKKPVECYVQADEKYQATKFSNEIFIDKITLSFYDLKPDDINVYDRRLKFNSMARLNKLEFSYNTHNVKYSFYLNDRVVYELDNNSSDKLYSFKLTHYTHLDYLEIKVNTDYFYMYNQNSRYSFNNENNNTIKQIKFSNDLKKMLLDKEALDKKLADLV